MSSKAREAFGRLVELTTKLRAPGGCAWDRAQTVSTIRPHLVEEFHEVIEALDAEDDEELRDELGDLLFLIVFIARMTEEEGPALLTARRLQEKAAAVGFDWDSLSDVIAKVDEELAELRQEIEDEREHRYEEELGDLLFAIVNIARTLGVDPEAALRKTNLKFRRRFAVIEERFSGRDLREVGLEAMDRVWNEAKEGEEPG